MDLFRLTYFNCSKDTESKWTASERFEVYGSGEAICDLYRHLIRWNTSTDGCAPRFIEIFNKDGVNLTEEYRLKGDAGVVCNTCNTFR
jgi:hypothetical protein